MTDARIIHHIRRVLCLKAGEALTVFDGKGAEYLCAIRNLDEKAVLVIKEKRVILREGRQEVSLSVACAIPKKAKFDDIVDKLCQLGVSRIIPVITERVIVKLDKIKKDLRLKRWEKIAQSACQQSQRATIPLIEGVRDLRDLVNECKCFDLKIIPTLIGERKHISSILSSSISNGARNILILIGPEGDFSETEVGLCIKHGFLPASLGELVLKVDTAAISAAGFVHFYAHC